jgi:hypothetical protein
VLIEQYACANCPAGMPKQGNGFDLATPVPFLPLLPSISGSGRHSGTCGAGATCARQAAVTVTGGGQEVGAAKFAVGENRLWFAQVVPAVTGHAEMSGRWCRAWSCHNARDYSHVG